MTERYYNDGTEPDVLPHYARCHGPCDQGRKPCPCPVACEMEAPDELSILGIFVKFIVGVLAMIGFGVLVGALV